MKVADHDLSAVQTVQGDAGCRFFGMDGAPTTVKESIDGMVAKVL